MGTDIASPVFLLASERSGTNLFRRRLWSAQSALCAPSPIHLLQTLFPALPSYGDLIDDAAFREVIEDALGLCYQHFSPWDEEIRCDDVVGAYEGLFGRGRNLVGIMHVIYSLYARTKGYKGYFCKDNDLFDYFFLLRHYIPDARFVYMHRDPRDFVLSQRQRPHQSSSIVRLAELWRDEQTKCLAARSFSRHEAVVVKLSYEELVSDEINTMRRVCSELGLPLTTSPDSKIFDERTDIYEWKNLDRPTMKENAGKFRRELSRSEIATIEGITWHTMLLLGYSPEARERPAVRRIWQEYEKQKHWFLDAIRRPLRRRLHITEGQKARSAYLKSLNAKYR